MHVTCNLIVGTFNLIVGTCNCTETEESDFWHFQEKSSFRGYWSHEPLGIESSEKFVVVVGGGGG